MEKIEEKLDRILLNQRAIMKNLCFGFKELRKDEILNSALLIGIEETNKLFVEDNSHEKKGCGKELGNCKCGEPCNICDGEIHLCEECVKQNKGGSE